MFAVAFDLTAADTEKHHPRGVSQAYTEIGAVRLLQLAISSRFSIRCMRCTNRSKLNC